MKDGKHTKNFSCCGECKIAKIREYARKHYWKNRENYLAYNKIWFKNNPTYAKKWNRKNRIKNRIRLNAYARQWRIKNRKRFLATQLRSRIKTIEKIRIRSKAYYWKNKPILLAKFKAWHSKPESKIKMRIAARIWRSKNREKLRIHYREYRLKNRNNIVACERNSRIKRRYKIRNGKVSSKEWEMLKQKFNHSCAYCSKIKPLAMDHVIPLSRGGQHDISNLLPACKSCNSRKNNKLISEYMPNFTPRFIS